jgi:hypothetical protein
VRKLKHKLRTQSPRFATETARVAGYYWLKLNVSITTNPTAKEKNRMNTQHASKIMIAVVLSALTMACSMPKHNLASSTDKAATANTASTSRAYGEEMPSEPAIVALSAFDFAGAGDNPVKVSGRIGKVCQVKGCWMMLSDGDAVVRVKFGQDDFFIPKDSQGEAIAYGKIVANEMSLAESKHMAEDAGIDPDTVTAPQKEYQLVATGVILK